MKLLNRRIHEKVEFGFYIVVDDYFRNWNMESRGGKNEQQLKTRPVIARRSCDQCRARKIGCERGSPCSNCITAKLDCTHSAVTTKATSPKHRILISAQYEQKIDEIASGIDGIRVLLTELGNNSDTNRFEILPPHQTGQVKPLVENQTVCVNSSDPPPWDRSTQIIDFVKAVIKDKESRDLNPESSDVVLSLKALVQSLENPIRDFIKRSNFADKNIVIQPSDFIMPPLDTAIAVLRWAKVRMERIRLLPISRILSLEKFTAICQKVYFSVDDYSDLDLILANGYLSYIYAEHFQVSELQSSQDYHELCQRNFHRAFARLPLLLPPCLDSVAALTLGALNALENCKASLAWILISTASNMCQTLKYHLGGSGESQIFWTVYQIEKGLSFRLGRSSTIRDAEITLESEIESRETRFARLQGKVYDQLYSPVGLELPANQRNDMAHDISRDLRKLIIETQDELNLLTDDDSMRTMYLQFDLICQNSLLAMVLRASSISDDCILVARYALDLHQECMMRVEGSGSKKQKYVNLIMLQTPFIPFSILFTRAIQLLDETDLGRLENFAASLRPEASISHPFQVYTLLCQAIRLYKPKASSIDPLDEIMYSLDMETVETMNVNGIDRTDLSDWYHENQRMMSLLNEDMRF